MTVVKTSIGDEYCTPRWVWEPWHIALGFSLDAAASYGNRLPPCAKHYTKEDSAFNHDWAKDAGHGAVWCHPPYSRAGGPLVRWVQKGMYESMRGAVVCMLLPSDTSTNWFSLLWDRTGGEWHGGVRGYFTEGKIRFVDPRTRQITKGSPTFGSVVVVLGGKPDVAPV